MDLTINEVVALAASIAACLSAIAAYLTVHQVAKQTRLSYRPDLVMGRTRFECCAQDQGIPDTWSCGVSMSDEDTIQRHYLMIPLRNVGLGAARDLRITWSFPIEYLVKDINERVQVSLSAVHYEYSNGTLRFKSEKSSLFLIWGNQQEDHVDFVLPISVATAASDIRIPSAYLMSVSSLLYYSLKAESAAPRKFPATLDVPPLTARFEYRDIGGKRYRVTVDLVPTIEAFHGGERAKFDGIWESRVHP